MSNYIRSAISNGRVREQAMIRRWWYEKHGACGRMVWEYYLKGKYADSIWFPDADGVGIEAPGQQTGARFPIRDANIVLCEAKPTLCFELIGQALVYAWLARQAGAFVRETVIFSEVGSPLMREAAESLGLTVVVQSLDDSAIDAISDGFVEL